MISALIAGIFIYSAPFRSATETTERKHLAGEPVMAQTQTLTLLNSPLDAADCKGNKVTFAVTVGGGTGPIHCVWKRKRPSDSGFSAFGAADSLKLPVYNIGVGTEAPDGTQYCAVVSDQLTTLLSASARLTVNQITAIAPTGTAVYSLNQGDNLSLTVNTGGHLPTGFQWIRKYSNYDWRDVTDHSSVSGSNGQSLFFTKIALADSGIYKVRVTFPTIDENHCVETSSITRTIHVQPIIDLRGPVFTDLNPETVPICPDAITEAIWNDFSGSVSPEGYRGFLLAEHSQLFDLSATHFSDDISPSGNLVLHWSIYRVGSANTPLLDSSGIPLINQTGQISNHDHAIQFPAPATGTLRYNLIFWLEDESGNLTPEAKRHTIELVLYAPPELVQAF
ncbi:MAG: hypothetical protein LWW85_04355 [Marinilabiliales bacterium]|nr:hypothetical protein [Marinilabiliales bacterium]